MCARRSLHLKTYGKNIAAAFCLQRLAVSGTHCRYPGNKKKAPETAGKKTMLVSEKVQQPPYIRGSVMTPLSSPPSHK